MSNEIRDGILQMFPQKKKGLTEYRCNTKVFASWTQSVIWTDLEVGEEVA